MEKGTLLFSHLTYVNGARENALWSPVPQAVWGTMISQESTGQWVESPARGYAVIWRGVCIKSQFWPLGGHGLLSTSALGWEIKVAQ